MTDRRPQVCLKTGGPSSQHPVLLALPFRKPSVFFIWADSRDGRGRGSVLAAEAESFAAFKQKWTLKLAKALATSFIEATSAYRKRANLDQFAVCGSGRRWAFLSCSCSCTVSRRAQ